MREILGKEAQKLLKKRIKGIPLIVVILLCTSILTVSALWFTWGLVDNLTYDSLDTPPTTTDYSNTGTFEVKDFPDIPDILDMTVTLAGDGNIGGEISVSTVLTLLDTSYKLESGYTITVTIKRPDDTVLAICTRGNYPVKLGDGGEPEEYISTSFGEIVVTDTIGIHTVEYSVTDMSWISPP